MVKHSYDAKMICKRTVKMPIGLWLVLMFGLYGCGGGNAKVQLSLEDLAELKNASQVFIVDYPSPEFTWTIMTSSLPLPNSVLTLNLEKVEKWLELPSPLELMDPTRTLKERIMATLEEKYHFTNLALPEGLLDDDLMDLRNKLKHGKVIDIKTDFWKLVPTGSETSQFLDPKKESYQFQYLGIMRVIDLNNPSVIRQRECHYPPENTNMGGWLRPKEYGSFSMAKPTWVNSMHVPELIANRGEKLQTQIHKAVTHCLQEFQKLFP